MVNRFIVPAALALGLLVHSIAPAAEPKLEARTYYVADLVIPAGTNAPQIAPAPNPAPPARVPPFASTDGWETSAPTKTCERDLIDLIAAAVPSNTSSIRYHPLTMSLVVNETAQNHVKIGKLLADLRRHHDHEVILEWRILSVAQCVANPQFVLRIEGIERPIEAATKRLQAMVDNSTEPQILSDREVFRLLEAAQGDTRTHITQAPKLTLFSGQTAKLKVQTNPAFLGPVTLIPTLGSGPPAFLPQQESVPIGVEMSAQAVISADRRHVRVSLNSALTTLTPGPVQTFPVVVPVFPTVPVDGINPNPATQYQIIRQPRVQRNSVSTSASIPDGGTMLLNLGTRVAEERCEPRCDFLPECLEDVPYVKDCANKLVRHFSSPKTAERTEYLFLLVTPRIIYHEDEKAAASKLLDDVINMRGPIMSKLQEHKAALMEECEPPAPRSDATPKCTSRILADLLAAYDEACADGRTEDAKRLAGAAMALDPTCFKRK